MTHWLHCDSVVHDALFPLQAGLVVAGHAIGWPRVGSLLDTTGVCPLAQAKSRVGRIEQIIGRWLAGRRHQFIVAIKAVGKVGPAPWD